MAFVGGPTGMDEYSAGEFGRFSLRGILKPQELFWYSTSGQRVYLADIKIG